MIEEMDKQFNIYVIGQDDEGDMTNVSFWVEVTGSGEDGVVTNRDVLNSLVFHGVEGDSEYASMLRVTEYTDDEAYNERVDQLSVSVYKTIMQADFREVVGKVKVLFHPTVG